MKVPNGTIKKNGKTSYKYCDIVTMELNRIAKSFPEGYSIIHGNYRQSYNPQQNIVEVRGRVRLKVEDEYYKETSPRLHREALKKLEKYGLSQFKFVEREHDATFYQFRMVVKLSL